MPTFLIGLPQAMFNFLYWSDLLQNTHFKIPCPSTPAVPMGADQRTPISFSRTVDQCAWYLRTVHSSSQTQFKIHGSHTFRPGKRLFIQGNPYSRSHTHRDQHPPFCYPRFVLSRCFQMWLRLLASPFSTCTWHIKWVLESASSLCRKSSSQWPY